MRLRDIPTYQSKYLKPEDLRGRSVAVKVREVTVEEFMSRNKKNKEINAVLWFENKHRGLVINKTRLGQLEKIFGTDETEQFIGRLILLHPTKQNGKDTIFISDRPADSQ